MHLTIEPYKYEFKDKIIVIWENSVRATHGFLKQDDITYYKEIVRNINFSSFQVYCCITDEEKLIGFVGVADKKVEMLFLEPTYIGKGIGKLLIKFAINDLKAKEVDVNEQNINAVEFYRKAGFIIYDKLPLDSEGKNYPILKMRLK